MKEIRHAAHAGTASFEEVDQSILPAYFFPIGNFVARFSVRFIRMLKGASGATIPGPGEALQSHGRQLGGRGRKIVFTAG